MELIKIEYNIKRLITKGVRKAETKRDFNILIKSLKEHIIGFKPKYLYDLVNNNEVYKQRLGRLLRGCEQLKPITKSIWYDSKGNIESIKRYFNDGVYIQ